MSADEQQPKKNGRGVIPLEDVVAPLIFIGGSVGSSLLLRRYLGLPFWAALVGGIVGFYIVAMAGLWLLSGRR